MGERASTRQGCGGNILHIGGSVIVLGAHLAKAPGLLEHAAEGGEHQVDGGGGLASRGWRWCADSAERSRRSRDMSRFPARCAFGGTGEPQTQTKIEVSGAE